ncbi:uroporphyrinogen-III C-methyltransferase [Microbacterium sp.]|uniref:uroporphyrinogen-III C-methyltransferase n=1 Tax=Microbacterium sp. TaxID=51671 RepID=UPI002811C807|nr:uroporphyrinogen-III C-methyltransferase [Microbacterium sp.]
MTSVLGLSLTDRLVLVVGGGAVSARRISRFLADGARVRLVAPELSPAVRALLDAPGVTWRSRRFRSADLRGAWVVHTATGDPVTDRAIAALCERRRTFCVNASDGAHGTARMTAQIRSGDVVIGVAGEVGVDPTRAARVRDEIGTLLTEGRLPVRARRAAAVGRVDLVGGGPGPVDLMTVRARRLLAEADVVVTDRLGPSAAVLSELDPDVLVIDVGKRPGDHPVPQDEINALLIAHATAGRRVVRLKGGDPFVFGRGGEEMAACLAAGIPVDVVPAPSSAVAVPQAAGIPVTHRGVASAFHVVNGQGPVSDTTLRALADETVTTVVLMGVAGLPRLVDSALRHGIPAARAVAIVENGHTAAQRTIRSTLGAVVADAAAAGVRNPAVIVIGDVARADLLLPRQVAVGGAAG